MNEIERYAMISEHPTVDERPWWSLGIDSLSLSTDTVWPVKYFQHFVCLSLFMI